jgi:hypothetical protein
LIQRHPERTSLMKISWTNIPDILQIIVINGTVQP